MAIESGRLILTEMRKYERTQNTIIPEPMELDIAMRILVQK